MSAPYDEPLAARREGIYESHYLKANAPDGAAALWLKHTLFRPRTGPAVAELWAVVARPGQPARVVRADVPWDRLRLEPGPVVDAGEVRLDPLRARGRLGGLTWDLALSGGLGPLLHLRWPLLYRGPFPRKKILTPAAGLRLDGRLGLDGRDLAVQGWVGLRGHNWGTEHAWSYAYGNCNLWDDGAARAVDGFTARIRLGGRPTPPLSSLLLRGPPGDRVRNQPWRWFGAGSFTLTSWSARWRDLELRMECTPEDLVGLRYNQPAGGEGYCYNTKFARTTLRVGRRSFTSGLGELETFFPRPAPDIPLHPPAGWSADDGVYDSARQG